MLGRVLLAAVLSGIAAGLFMAVIQHVRITPLILAAEKIEMTQNGGANLAVGEGHNHNGAPGHDHLDASWLPANGLERTIMTTLSSVVAGAGFAAMLTGLSFVLAIPITPQNGFIWGLAGFLAVSLAPAAGLPPELPGMAAADLTSRQVWWLLTILCTGAALWLLFRKPFQWTVFLALGVVLLPHMLGAPELADQSTAVEPALVQKFVANSIAANAVFWSLLGIFLGQSLDRFAKDSML